MSEEVQEQPQEQTVDVDALKAELEALRGHHEKLLGETKAAKAKAKEEAEAKKRNGELPDDYAGAVLKPFVQSLTQEVARALQFFFTSTPYNRVDHILLAGGSSSLPGLAEAVSQQTGCACSLANPFDGMEIGSGIRLKKMAREAPSYLTSCGLAMRRFQE